MINIYNSHSLEKLAHHFSEILHEETTEPLQPTWVVVQNNEIKEWLSIQIASKKGIAGNFRFIFPSEFMWALYRLKNKDIPQSLPSDLIAMQWALFDLLGKDAQLLDMIPAYDNQTNSPQKRFQLSGQLADVFDQYQVYRPFMTEAWLHQRLITKNKHEKWQAILWRELNKYWSKHEATSTIPSRSGAYRELIDSLMSKDEVLLRQLPDQLYVFGLSHLTHPFLELISHVSVVKDIQFLHRRSLKNFDDQKVQDLLSGWEASSKNQFELFQHLLNKISAPVSIHNLDEKPISNLSELAVHSCHNSRREVEVLKDEVLSYLEEHADAGPEDVLILVPDAETYISELETIFRGSEGEPKLPVSKIFQSLQSDEHALITLLDSLDSSHKPSTILELINLHPIKQVYSFSDDELEQLETWILENSVQRGIGDTFNSSFSWQKGLNQLLLGFVMEPDELELYKDLVPYPSISSNEDMMLTARFSSFTHSFIQYVQAAKNKKKPYEWINWIKTLVQTFLDNDTEKAASGIYRTLEKLKEQIDYSDITEDVSFQIIKGWVKAQFSSKDSSSGRFGQGITISSYIPYRSVPFKFIAVLGLNEGIFPRKSVRPEFDLIYASPLSGDRLQKEDDTYLFLETVLAAGEHLHISYQGQDQRADSNRLPSMLVQQLMDMLNEDDFSFYEHKLHPFNADYFSDKHGLRSYSSINLKVAENLEKTLTHSSVFITPDLAGPDLQETQIVNVKDLISYFTHPSKFLAQKYIGFTDSIYLNEIIDREPFSLNPLDSFYLEELIDSSLSRGHSEKKIGEFVQAAGMIPDRHKGKKVFQDEFNKVQELHTQLSSITSEKEQVLEIDISLEQVQVKGKIPGIYGDKLITRRVGKRKPKYEIGHWLKHLLAVQSGAPIQKSIFLSIEKNNIEVLELNSEDIKEGQFIDYLNWFLDKGSFLHNTAFFPDTSKAYAKKWAENKNKGDALFEARKTWEPSYRNTFVESNDYYNRVIWRDQDPLIIDNFHENALRFWVPFLEATGEEE